MAIWYETRGLALRRLQTHIDLDIWPSDPKQNRWPWQELSCTYPPAKFGDDMSSGFVLKCWHTHVYKHTCTERINAVLLRLFRCEQLAVAALHTHRRYNWMMTILSIHHFQNLIVNLIALRSPTTKLCALNCLVDDVRLHAQTDTHKHAHTWTQAHNQPPLPEALIKMCI